VRLNWLLQTNWLTLDGRQSGLVQTTLSFRRDM
jgi:hypothetical protein